MISGNTSALIQVKDSGTFNAIGERSHTWADVTSLHGWLDLSTGESNYLNNAKMQDSTHIFIADFSSLKGVSKKWVWNPLNLTSGVIQQDSEQPETVDLTSENGRMVINGGIYNILLIDNPMGMNRQLEIYLKYLGGQNG